MANLTLKTWIYEKIASEAFCKGKTIVWKKHLDLINGGDKEVYTIKIKEIVRETEKAICVDCVYWYNLSRSVNFTEYTGYKVWIPKSAILKGYEQVNQAVAM